MARIASLAFAAALLCYGQRPEIESQARIEGHVVDSLGNPVASASVSLLGARRAADVRSDADGKFVFERIERGTWTLTAQKPGYVLASPAVMQVTLQPGERRAGIALRLTPPAIISGKITNPDGDPVRLSLLQKVPIESRTELRPVAARVDTHPDGTYRISEIPPGSYYLSATARFATYYPGVAEPSAAVPIEAAAGETRGIDFRLQSPRVFNVRGRIVNPATNSPVDGEVHLATIEGVVDTALWRGVRTQNGVFQLDDVLPGAYQLTAFPTATGNLLGQQDVIVGGTDLEIVVPLSPVVNVAGTISVEGGGSLESLLNVDLVIRLYPDGGPASRNLTFPIRRDGRFSLSGIQPGSWIEVAGEGSKFSVKSVRFDGQEATRQRVRITPGGHTVEVVVAPLITELTGALRDAANSPVPNGRVTLSEATGSIIRSVATNANGSFTFLDLPPGEYSLLGWQQVDASLEANPEFRARFAAKAIPVRLEDGSRVFFDVPAVKHDAIQAEAATLP